MRNIRFPLTFLIVLLVSHQTGPAQSGFEVDQPIYVEEIRDATLIELHSENRAGASRYELSFFALGRHFELQLEPTRLYAPDAMIRWVTPSGDIFEKPEVSHYYKGRLIGESGSWVRMSIREGRASGIIRTAQEVYLLRPAAYFDRSANPRSVVAYRMSDLPSLWDTYSCDVDDDMRMPPDEDARPERTALSDFQMTSNELQQQASGLALKEVEINLVADGAYFTAHGSSAATRMADVIHDMSGIYENDVGVIFSISGATVYTPATDPFTESTSPSDLLESFTFDQSHTVGHDLAHLFTGRDLDGSTVGIAWLSVVCRDPYGTGLSQDLSNSTYRMLLTAHEVGHNFSAIHDGSGDCSATPYGYIMWPSLNPSATEFSDCSQSFINSHVDSRSCLSEVLPAIPSEDILALIVRYYNDILGRPPEPGGAEWWSSEIERLIALGVDVQEGFITVAKQFFNSQEYLNRGRSDWEYAGDLYQTFFERTPSQAERDFWIDQILQGVSRNTVMNAFVFSVEFNTYMAGIFGPRLARPENNLINDSYRGLLSRLPDNSGFNYWLGRVRTAQCGGNPAEIRNLAYQIVSLFLSLPEYANRNRDSAGYIEDLYDGIMRREGDPAGVNYWIDLLETGGKSQDEVLQDFTGSTEFQVRVDEVIAVGCYASNLALVDPVQRNGPDRRKR